MKWIAARVSKKRAFVAILCIFAVTLIAMYPLTVHQNVFDTETPGGPAGYTMNIGYIPTNPTADDEVFVNVGFSAWDDVNQLPTSVMLTYILNDNSGMDYKIQMSGNGATWSGVIPRQTSGTKVTILGGSKTVSYVVLPGSSVPVNTAVRFLINADGSNVPWSSSSGLDYQCLSETTPNDDANYVYTNSVSDEFLSFENPSGYTDINQPIVSVTLCWRIKGATASVSEYFGLKIGSGNYYSGGNTYATTYSDLYKVWTTNPATGQVWSWSALADIQGIVGHRSQGLEARCTWGYLEVIYLGNMPPSIVSNINYDKPVLTQMLSVTNGNGEDITSNFRMANIMGTVVFTLKVTQGGNWVNSVKLSIFPYKQIYPDVQLTPGGYFWFQNNTGDSYIWILSFDTTQFNDGEYAVQIGLTEHVLSTDGTGGGGISFRYLPFASFQMGSSGTGWSTFESSFDLIVIIVSLVCVGAASILIYRNRVRK